MIADGDKYIHGRWFKDGTRSKRVWNGVIVLTQAEREFRGMTFARSRSFQL